MDALPRLGLSRFAVVALFVTFFLGSYEAAVLAVALPSVTIGLSTTQAQLALPVSLNLIGGALGAYAIGWFADRFGRQTGLRLTFLILGAGSLATGLAWNVESLSVFRFVAGAGMGAVLPLFAGYMGEMAPKAGRGRAVAAMSLAGTFLIAVATVAAVPLLNAQPGQAWRYLLGIGAISLVLVPFINKRDLLESPRWLVERGRIAEATLIVRMMERRSRGRLTPDDVQFIEAPSTVGVETEKPLKALLGSKIMRNRLIMIVVMLFVFFAGFFGINTYVPLFLEAAGLSQSDATLVTALSKTVVLVASVVIIFVIERIERRTLAILSIILIALSVVLMISGLGAPAATIGAFLLGFGTGALSAPLFTYTAEIFATNVRGTAATIADGIGALGGATAPFLILPLLTNVGALPAGLVVIGLLVVSSVILMFGVRTKDLSLEQINGQ